MVEATGAGTVDRAVIGTVDRAAMAVRIAGSRACLATEPAWSLPHGSPNAVGTSASASVQRTAAMAVRRARGEPGDACRSSFSFSRECS